MSPKISVIIPLYNAKEFIRSCVESLLRQTMDDIEILLIDDCSTDGSLEYCRELYGANPKVRILTQSQNGGPGAARNRGIAEAKGEYIAFVDSDDQLRSDGFSEMYRAATETDADVLHVAGILIPTADELPEDISTVPDDGITPISFDFTGRSDKRFVLGDDLDERFAKWKEHAYHWSVWNKLFKRSFLLDNKITFCDLRLAEDMQFCFRALFLAKTYTIIPGAWYYWRVVMESSSRTKKLAPLIAKSVEAEIQAGPIMRESVESIPYFRGNRQKALEASFYLMDSLEVAFIRPCFARLGREAVQNDKEIAGVFMRHYGEEGDAAFYHFLEMLDHAPLLFDMVEVFNGKNAWEQFRYDSAC